ncbi:MAG: hypothetical protein OXB84_06340 [Halobacteriovoraceae bacterium]|nr:hypothetical protein [Halobacteriovoraceae bacterium]
MENIDFLFSGRYAGGVLAGFLKTVFVEEAVKRFFCLNVFHAIP